MAMALSRVLLSLGGSLRHLYPVLGKPVIYHYYQENSSLWLPDGEQLLLDNNSLFYVPRSLRLLYFIAAYASGGDIKKDEQFGAAENELLNTLRTDVQVRYHSLVEKLRNQQNISPKFRAAVKGLEPSPVTGYLHAAFLPPPAKPSVFLPEVKREINLFAYYLTRHGVAREIGGYIDMLARDEDPLRSYHTEAYQKVVANSGKNCGALVYRAIADDFLLTRQAAGPAGPAQNTQNPASKNSKKRY
jgi:hypothetical protein